jgi:hypothetical protein
MSCIASAVSNRGVDLQEGPAAGFEGADTLGGEQPVRGVVGADREQV